jgi:hypothetical protein
MAAPPKGTARPAENLDHDTADELEQIMNDIEELQEEMAHEEASEGKRKPAPAAAAAPAAKARPALKAVPAAEEDDAELADFRGGSGDVSMEETLAGLEDEAPPTGKSLLDDDLAAIEQEAEAAAADEITEDPEAITDEELTDEMADIVDHLNGTENGLGKKEVAVKAAQKTTHRTTTGGAEEGSLTLSVSGAMSLKLRYEGGDQEIEVALAGDALVVRLSDGSEFRIPVKAGRSAA